MEEKRLSHFRLVAKIGEGGMGIVYKAEDEKLRRPVAVKLLPPDLVGDPVRRRRLLREAQAAAAVRHPTVAAIYEVGEEGEAAFIVMELVEGQTLRALMGDQAVAIPEALRIVTEIARGLERAHACGVIHRDLKPDNVMMEADGHVKILDFGLAKLREPPVASVGQGISKRETWDAELTQRGSLVGTAAYMSPEQARGQAVDPRSDLFTLGVLLYELVTGRNPFRGPSPMDTLSAILKDRPLPASAVNPEVTPALDRVLERLLAKDPRERPASATALIEELEAVGRSPQRLLTADDGPPRRSIAVLPFADMSQEKDQDYFCEGIAEELITALAHVEGLRVAARTSAFQFKGRADDVRRIGQQLGVETVLEGSVRKAGSRLRVTAQLVSTADGYHLWSERYDREMEDVFAIQDEIAATIVQTLKIRLVGEGAIPRVRRSTEDPEAYRLYLQGRYWWNKRHEVGLRKGLDFFDQAIAKDPSYALAYAGVADSYSTIGFYGFQPPKTAFAKAKQAAERALALDESLAEAHTAVGLVDYG
jgi:serine/threonine protein kinase